MSNENNLEVVESAPQQLITIEPAKYVELVFEPFAKRLAIAKADAPKVKIDVTTTAGMAVAVKYRATFREIRVSSEKARKERKAPILEIGKLLDSRQKEIEAEIEPYESKFDAAIKAEEARKEAEKAAKAVAEKARVDGIRKLIDEIKTCPAECVGRSAAHIQRAIDTMAAHEITIEEFAEFAGEAQMAKMAALTKLGDALAAQQAHEAEQIRIAEERALLERERAEAAERERQAAAARVEQERRDREVRETEEARLRAEREAHEAELRRQRQAEEMKLAEARAEIERQQAEIAAARAEQERREREAQEAKEKEERQKREQAEAAARAEAERIEAKRKADAAEQVRRAREQFELNGPAPLEMIEVLAAHYQVEQKTVLQWINLHEWAAMEIAV